MILPRPRRRLLLLRRYSYSGRRSSVDPLRNTPWKRSVSTSLRLSASSGWRWTRVTCGFRKLLRANQPGPGSQWCSRPRILSSVFSWLISRARKHTSRWESARWLMLRSSRKREGIQRKIGAARRLASARKGENVVRANYPLAREQRRANEGKRKKVHIESVREIRADIPGRILSDTSLLSSPPSLPLLLFRCRCYGSRFTTVVITWIK